MNNINDVKEAIYKLPNAKLENEVVKYFKGQDESLVMEVSVPLLENLADRKRIAFINVLTRAISKKNYLILLLNIGIEKKLVSEIKGWFVALLPKIGVKRTIQELKSYSDFETVDIALYQLRSVVKLKFENELNHVDEFESNFMSQQEKQ